MDEFGQHLKERLHSELDGAEPSPDFWHNLESRQTVHNRRRIASRIAAVAASVAFLAVGGITLFEQLDPVFRCPRSRRNPTPLPSPRPPHASLKGP